MTTRNKIEVAVAKQFNTGLVQVYTFERKCKELMPYCAFFLMFFVPIGIIALVEFLN